MGPEKRHECTFACGRGGRCRQVVLHQFDAGAGRRIKPVGLIQFQPVRPQKRHPATGGPVDHTDVPLVPNVHLHGRVQPPLEARGLGRAHRIEDEDRFRFHEQDAPGEPLQFARVRAGRLSGHVIELRRRVEVQDFPQRVAGVRQLPVSIDRDAVHRFRMVHPALVMLAAVDVPSARANQQPFSEGIEEERILGFVSVAVRSERTALENQLHVLAGIFQIGIEHGLARPPENARCGQVDGTLRRHPRQGAPDKADITGLGWQLTVRLHVPLPVRILGHCREERHHAAILRGYEMRGQVPEAAAPRAGRLEVHRIVADL